MEGSDAGALLLTIVFILFICRRPIGRLLSRLWIRPLADKRPSDSNGWTSVDERLLEAIRLAASLRRTPPQAGTATFPLERSERLLFSVSSCSISVLRFEVVSFPQWRTKIIQKSIAGYFITPAINLIRNWLARAKAKRQLQRTATWSMPIDGALHLTNKRLVFESEMGSDPIPLRTISRIRRGDTGVSFQVGVETKTNLPDQVVIKSSNDDWLYVALVYSALKRVPKSRLSESFKTRASNAGHHLSTLAS